MHSNYRTECGNVYNKMEFFVKANHYFLFNAIQRIPYKTDTPIGFSIAILMQYIFIVDIMTIIECFVLIGISTLPIIFAMTNDIVIELNGINMCLKYKKLRLKMAKQFIKLVQFHSDTIQLSFI